MQQRLGNTSMISKLLRIHHTAVTKALVPAGAICLTALLAMMPRAIAAFEEVTVFSKLVQRGPGLAQWQAFTIPTQQVNMGRIVVLTGNDNNSKPSQLRNSNLRQVSTSEETSEVSRAVVEWNGDVIFDPSSFGEQVDRLEAPVQYLAGNNVLRVRIVSALGSTIRVTLLAEDLSLAPEAPVLDPHNTLTNQLSLTLAGTATDGAVTVEVVTPSSTFTVPVANTRFTADVPLLADQVNRISFRSVDGAGINSPVATTAITVDTQAPNVFIDFPVDGEEITTGSTDVAGRVGDLLSGFMGLAVNVNGVVAEIDVGVGNNGTFLARNVPLTPGLPNVLIATATDTLGNPDTAEISVVQLVVPPNTPQIQVISGNGQTALASNELPQPIVVEVTQADGSLFVNKIVTFEVMRSDGLLSETAGATTNQMLQLRTDSVGRAQAFWTLGSDAGCGNNRVRVTSTSIVGTVGFCASAIAGSAQRIAIDMGDNQKAETSGTLLDALRVWVYDGNNGVPGIPVIFRIVDGNGNLEDRPLVVKVTDATGHAEVDFTLGSTPGINRVSATFSGNPNPPVSFAATGIGRTLGPTSFAGVVLDNSSQPVQGVEMSLVIANTQLQPVFTDNQGQFRFEELTQTGIGKLLVDGRTASQVGGRNVPLNSFPPLHFEPIVIVGGAENSLPMPILLPEFEPLNERIFDGSQDVEMTIRARDSLGQPFEVIQGLRYVVAKDTVITLEDGTIAGPSNPVTLRLNMVDFDKVPMPMPDGASPPFAATLKPANAVFDPPVRVEMPNLLGLAPGAVASLASFDPATARFGIVGTATVSSDGLLIVSDPGSGLVKGEWHGPNNPNRQPTGGADGDQGGDDDQEIGEDEEKPKPPSTAPSDDGCPPPDELLDPVYLFNGEFYEETEDLRIAGRGMDFVWSRKYRSKSGPDTRQGNGWDCSYNIFIAELGPDILLCDGNSRADTYVVQSDGTWFKQGYFRELSRNPDGSYRLTFEDTGRWNFFAIDGSVTAGLISSIVDRNGNAISFAYDAMGRLQTITDTLDRDITVAYNADGFIESVTDFANRQCVYTYYQDSDADGASGDLRSVRTPTVIGTPTGNDFALGKTTVYTYSKGFADLRLNHNLLTVTDPKGQLYLQNTYGLNSADIGFDRVIRQVWGNLGDIIDVVYVPQTPTQANEFAIIKVIVNDRVGNVGEYSFNAQNVGVLERRYTGRADPDLPTSETANRPAGKLRATDPEFFERRQEWNSERKRTCLVEPDGSETFFIYESDLNPNASPRSAGNMRARVQVRGSQQGGSDQPNITEIFDYDSAFGAGCCGTNFVTRYVDGRGDETLHVYDARGNRTHTTERISTIVHDYTYNAFGQLTSHTLPDNGSGHRREDTYSYYDLGPQRGYMQNEVVDAGGFDLTTAYEYDLVGNVSRVTDPRGNDMTSVYNELDQVVRHITREVEPGIGPRYEVDTFYDANDNIVRVDIQNVDDQGTVVAANPYLSKVFEFEILNYPIRTIEEVGVFDVLRNPPQLNGSGLPPGEFRSMEYVYDGNRNQVLTRYGEAVEGRQPDNVVQSLYDERDLLMRIVQAPGHPNQSTTQYDYDENENLIRTLQGIEGSPHVTENTYDLFDRVTSTLDPMGNRTSYSYDANYNLSSVREEGEILDVPGSANNVLLTEVHFLYDAVDREIRQETAFFDTATSQPLPGGQGIGIAVATTEYSDNSQVVRAVNDNGHETVIGYDTANRTLMVTDAKGNSITNVYDDNSNVVTTTVTERSDVAGASDEIFTMTYGFDGIDRQISHTDNVGNTDPGSSGNTMRYFFDSRSNQSRTIDALGNVERMEFDSIDRLITERRVLTDDGTGAGAVVGEIVTTQGWDDTDRLRSQADDHGNATRYAYDPLNRSIVTQMADGTTHQVGTGVQWFLGAADPNLAAFTSGYDVHHNATATFDANGNAVASVYDLLDRKVSSAITPGPGVSSDTTFELFQYDGLSRMTRAEDDDSIVTWGFDSQSQIVVETQNGKVNTSNYDGMANRIRQAFPGGRVLTTTYDDLERIATITDETLPAASRMIASYEYVGPGRVTRRSHGNGTQLDYAYDGITGVANPASDFGERSIVGTRHVFNPGPSEVVIDNRAYTWDREGNKTQRRALHASGSQLSHGYEYDSIYRLRNTMVTDVGMAVVRNESYVLDDVGNRDAVTGGSQAGAYTLESTLPEPADFQVNQYTTTSFDSRSHDSNGNLSQVNAGAPTQRNVSYDYGNRIVEAVDVSTGERHTYAYDVLGRRIARVVDADGVSGPPSETRYFYQDARVCEEQDALGSTAATYAYGLYVDEVLEMERGSSEFFYHCDDLHNVMALTDAAGAIAERYEYADFGMPAFFDGISAPIAQSAIGNPYLFQGRRFDPETDFYYFRNRYYEPQAGRFVQRDRVWDPTNIGNQYAFVGNNPMSNLDPYGLLTIQIGPEFAGGLGLGGKGGVGIVLQFGGGEIFDAALYETHGGGVVLGGELGVSGQLTWSNSLSSTIEDLNGTSISSGGTVALGPGVSGEKSVPTGAGPTTYSLGLGAGAAFEGHIYKTETNTSSTLGDAAQGLLNSWLAPAPPVIPAAQARAQRNRLKTDARIRAMQARKKAAASRKAFSDCEGKSMLDKSAQRIRDKAKADAQARADAKAAKAKAKKDADKKLHKQGGITLPKGSKRYKSKQGVGESKRSKRSRRSSRSRRSRRR